MLSLVPGEGARVASLAGWGLVLATMLNLWDPGGSVKKVSGPSPANTATVPAARAGTATTPTATKVPSSPANAARGTPTK